MVQQWVDGERMTADKANHLCVRKVTTSELNGTSLDKEEGDLFYDSDKKRLVGWCLGRPCYYNRIAPGTVRPWAGVSAPDGWLPCDGTAISRTTYDDLYGVIGTTYGNGNGSTTFNLPDLETNHRFINCATDDNELGDTGGEEEHTLTEDELPAHTHGIYTSFGYSTPGRLTAHTDGYIITSGTTETTSKGGDDAHNNLPAYININFIIKT